MNNGWLKWRLIPLIETSGTVQMSIDNWLFRQQEKRPHIPSLRFYSWSNPTISLGRLQKKYPDYWHDITYKNNPLELVVRPTGGRAVLHQGDLTYAVIMPLEHRKTLEIYQDICTFLIEGWYRLGIDLQYGVKKRGYIGNSSCFNTSTVADLVTADGSKLIGSAQRRGKRAILQHGSMVLSTDKALFQTIFNQSAPWNLSLIDLLPNYHSIEQIITTLTEAAKQHFKIDFITQPLSDEEWQAILSN